MIGEKLGSQTAVHVKLGVTTQKGSRTITYATYCYSTSHYEYVTWHYTATKKKKKIGSTCTAHVLCLDSATAKHLKPGALVL